MFVRRCPSLLQTLRQSSSSPNGNAKPSDLLSSIAASMTSKPKRGGNPTGAQLNLDQLLNPSASTTAAPALGQSNQRNRRGSTVDAAPAAFKPNFTIDLPPTSTPTATPMKGQTIPKPSEKSDLDHRKKPVSSGLGPSVKPQGKAIPQQPKFAPVVDTFDAEDDDDNSFSRNKRKHTGKKDDRKTQKSSKPEPEYSQKQKKDKEKKKVVEQPKDIFLPDGISVVNMGSLLGVSYEKLASKMKELGFEYPTPDFVLNTDISSLIALEFGMNPIVRTPSAVEVNFKPRCGPAPEDWSSYPFRPPIVTILGHVDHGKTTLLDTLRKTSVAAGEAGGITQHIGAFNVTLPSGKKITFLDTPGHAAFSAMRARGARVTDIAVLVVAADDGVMPQTVEALKFAQDAGVQIVVAVNKCDKPGATPSKVKESLIRYGLLVEDYGGEVPAVEVSGLTGLGLDKLEETIIAVSEMADIRGDATGPVEATVIESRVAKGKGNVTTMLVTRGTLKPGQILVAGTSWCKVRTLCDERGKPLKEAGPSAPVEISGWKDLPNAGDFALEAENEGIAKEVVESRLEDVKRQESMKSIEDMNAKRIKARELEAIAKDTKSSKQSDSDEETSQSAEPTSTAIPLPIVLKCDVHGSVEALIGALAGFPTHEVNIQIISSGVGQITDSDVELAYAANARILAFNVPVDKKVSGLAATRKVPLDSYNIIYKLMDDLQEKMLDLLPKEEITVTLGEADVLQVFELNTKSKEQERIAGCRIMSGKVLKNERVRVLRGEDVVYDGKLKAFKHHKKDIPEASKGLECGMAFEGFNNLMVGDRVSCYRIDKKRRTKLNYQ
ncbi:hypothetical protein HDU79_006560 [Rhizoclosmatium sp. JEL0117]|nr:hypothetical protein HDU79_006560 [Rhizoclosmatium sp. JEL0117]